MKKLVLGFTDTYENATKFFMDVLSTRYEVVRDDLYPDYLIFGDRNFGENNLKYSDCTKIFYTGENQRYWNYDCNYAITFDHINSPKHYRLPLYVLEMKATVYDGLEKDWLKLLDFDPYFEWEELYDVRKNGFSYIQANPNCEFRTRFVDHFINSGRKVAAGGPHFNNIGYVIPRDRKLKIDFMNKYKFNIAFENGAHPGYVTEKLMDAFYAKTLPIYWGSKTVSRDFNPKAFINYMDYRSRDDGMKEFEQYIDHIANDKDAYLDILMERPFVGDRINEYVNLDNFLDWFDAFVYRGSRL